jgi:hypothetical protein
LGQDQLRDLILELAVPKDLGSLQRDQSICVIQSNYASLEVLGVRYHQQMPCLPFVDPFGLAPFSFTKACS